MNRTERGHDVTPPTDSAPTCTLCDEEVKEGETLCPTCERRLDDPIEEEWYDDEDTDHDTPA